MSQHTLQGRSDTEIRWFQRRSFLQAAASWTALGGIEAAQAQSRSNIVELVGDALVNGQPLRPQHTIQTGDDIQTGPKSHLIFVIGNSSFHVRQNSRLHVGRGATINTVSLLRLLSGAIVSVWGKGPTRQIITPNLTAGIRGTGVYTEIFAEQDGRSYFCNCYGTVQLNAGSDSILYQSDYHKAYWAEVGHREGAALTLAKAINHSDEELEFLARLVNQRTAWQIKGKKGPHSEPGYD